MDEQGDQKRRGEGLHSLNFNVGAMEEASEGETGLRAPRVSSTPPLQAGLNAARRQYNKGVHVPVIPGPFDQIGRRAFSFFPAIVGIEHNQWVLRRVTWSEIEVMNKKSFQELSIPRRLVGEVSVTREPFLIVGLVKELEYREGAVWPHVRRVIEMPRAVNGPPRRFAAERPAPVIGIGLDPSPARAWRRVAACVALAMMLIAAGILACVQAVGSHLRGGREVRTPPAERLPVRAIPTW